MAAPVNPNVRYSVVSPNQDQAKLKRYGSVLVVILSTTLAVGLFHRTYNSEYFEVLGALRAFEPSGECEMDLEIERSWLYLGGARLYAVRLSNGEHTLSSKASVNFYPTRIINQGNRFYHYEWSVEQETKIVGSYLDLEIDRDGDVRRVEVGRCDSSLGAQEYRNYQHRACFPKTKSITCVPNNGFNTDAGKAGAG